MGKFDIIDFQLLLGSTRSQGSFIKNSRIQNSMINIIIKDQQCYIVFVGL